MKNSKGFTLIELLAVIVVLAIVTVIASSSILPYMSNARPDAFKVEATNVIKSASDATDLYFMNQVKLKGNESSCLVGNVICFTIKELSDLGLYKDRAGNFSGKVLVNISNRLNPTYELYLQKGAEFNITAGTEIDYVNNGTVSPGGWASADAENYSKCSCS